MTATELQSWQSRHGHTLDTGAEALGLSRRMFAYYLSGEKPITQTVALLCAALDRLTKRRNRK